MFFLVLLLLGGVASSPAKKSRYGLIASPNFPKTYPNNNHSIWNIAVPEGYHISLQFLVFDIEPSDGCTYDYVKLWADNKELGRFCGSPKSKSHPGHRMFISESNKMRIEFQSDFSNEENGSTILYPGFQAYYKAEDNDECALPNDISASWIPPCQHICHNYIGGYFCSCLPGYKLQSDKRTCKVDCSSQLFMEEFGYISSPGYPKPYPADLNCNYSIRVEEGFHISLTFIETFDIDYHPRAPCPYDTLKVFAGGSLRGTYCGKKSPGTLKAQSNTVDILFHTDDSGDSKGWKVRYTIEAVKCPMPVARDTFSMISPVQKEFQMRDYIVVTCKTGYQLMENNQELSTFTSLCQKDGTWHRPMPRCQIVSCKSPDELRNGRYSFLTEPNKLTYLSVVTYNCNEPYYKMVTQRDSAKFTCTKDRIWQDEKEGVHIPICVPVCGKPVNPVTGHERIIRGENAELGNFPWQVLLNNGGRGGGILIGERWVMTAAHMIRPEVEENPDDVSNLQVYAGDTNVDKLIKKSYIAVQEVHVHPQYVPGIHDHDIALIHLREPITMDENTSPICLPEDGDASLYDTGTVGYVSGFGMTERNVISNLLKYVALPMVERSKCQQQLEEKQRNMKQNSKLRGAKFTENMFCAGYPEADKKQKDSCQGDSGGPFASEIENKWVATGIVSWGIGCGTGFGYYTKVSNYMNWIKVHLNS
ncbi:PREDICTED: complement C1r subcomponent [Nanorana parkeri]|uniref:complement C1r subcomponent n=1 Tax=Nanorana parkeri TaxID=125878 RepID=UPI000854B2E8|nr:PREDICTED: complement C1r subcomponent [Nanorana parkeri]